MNQETMRRRATQDFINSAKNASEPFVLGINRYYIEEFDTKPVLETLNLLLEDAETVRAFRGRLALDLTGFEGETRDPEDVPELRRYMRAISNTFPYWFWFGDTEGRFLKMLLYCLGEPKSRADISSKVVRREYGDDEIARFMGEYIDAIGKLQHRFGLTNSEIEAQLKRVSDYYRQMLSLAR